MSKESVPPSVIAGKVLFFFFFLFFIEKEKKKGGRGGKNGYWSMAVSCKEGDGLS